MKSKLAVLLSAALIVIISVFVFTDVRAEAPDSCTSYSFLKNGERVDGPYTISISKDNGDWPIPRNNCNFDNDIPDSGPGNACFEYKYEMTTIDGPITGIGQVTELVPIGVFACGDTGSLGCVSSSIQDIRLPGEGTTDVGPYGHLVDHEYALRFTSNSSLFSSVLSSNSVGVTSFAFKKGNVNYGCGPIKGIAPPRTGFAQGAITGYKEVITQDGFTMCLIGDPTTQCDQLVDCETKIPFESLPESTIEIEGHAIQYSSTPGSGCVSFIIRTEGDQSFYYFMNGRYYVCDVESGRLRCL